MGTPNPSTQPARQAAAARSTEQPTAAKLAEVEHYSNTSEDEYGLQGALADMADSIDNANNFIFLAGWMFSPNVHLPFYGEALRVGLQAHFQGKLDQAIKSYTTLIENNFDDNGHAAYFLSHALYQKGDVKRALEEATCGVDIHRDNLELRKLRVRLLLEQGKAKTAADDLRLLKRQFPDDTEVSCLAASCALTASYKGSEDKGKAQKKALNLYHDVLNREPTNKLAISGQGQIWLEQRRYALARKAFEKYIDYCPDDRHGRLQLIAVLEAQLSVVEQNLENAKPAQLPALKKQQRDLNDYLTSEQRTVCQLFEKAGDTTSSEYQKVYRKHLPCAIKNRKLFGEDVTSKTKDALDRETDALEDWLIKHGESGVVRAYLAEELAALGANEFALTHHLLLARGGYNADRQHAIVQAQAARTKFDPSLSFGADATAQTAFDLAIEQADREKIRDMLDKHRYCLDFLQQAAAFYQKKGDWEFALQHYARIVMLCRYNNTEQARAGLPNAQVHSHLNEAEQAIKTIQQQMEIAAAPAPANRARSFLGYDFDDAMKRFRQQTPSLGEKLIRKAIANPKMVIAINLWEQVAVPGNSDPNKHPLEELQKTADNMGVPLPTNLLIRTNRCVGVFNSHHSKYMVLDDGRGGQTGCLGSVDLWQGILDCAQHEIVNTSANNCVLNRAYSAHGGEHHMLAATVPRWQSQDKDMIRRIPRAPWRECSCRIRGTDQTMGMVREFGARWAAGAGDAFSQYTGSVDELGLVTAKTALDNGTTVTSVGTLDPNKLVLSKIQEIYLWLRDAWNDFFFDRAKTRFEQAAAREKPGHYTNATKELFKDYYCRSAQKVDLARREMLRLQDLGATHYSLVILSSNAYQQQVDRHHALLAKFSGITPEASREQALALVRDPVAQMQQAAVCETTVVRTANKAYYREEDWSHSDSTDTGLYDAYRRLIREANEFVYIENQYFCTSTDRNEGNQIANELIDRIVRAAKEGKDFHVYVNLPYFPNGNPDAGMAGQPLRFLQNQAIRHIMHSVEAQTQQPWHKFISFNFFAKWEGVNDPDKRLTDSKAISVAESRGFSRRAPIYNHSKMMIADGDRCLIGSANINDRSLVGDIDTEAGMVQDTRNHPAAKKKLQAFTKKLVRQYYGEGIAEKVEQHHQQDPNSLGLGSPAIVGAVSQQTTANMDSFASTEAGHCCSRETGLAVAFPWERAPGKTGEIIERHQVIPDAPRDRYGQSPDNWRWVPKEDLAFSHKVGIWTRNAT